MALEFQLPEIGEGVVEGEIVEWHVAPDDQVEPDQLLVSVLTDKATIEIASPFAGRILSLKGESGDIVEVGSELLSYETGNGAGKAESEPEPRAPKTTGEAATRTAGKGEVVDFQLPEIGEGVVEGEIIEWHVSPGDSVEQDTPVISVLTDKATIEITAPADGVIVETKGEPGEIVEVGDVIMKIRSISGAAVKTAAEPQPEQEETPNKPAPARTASVPSPPIDAAGNPSISAFGTPLATPAVRKYAAQKGLDLRSVRGTGPNHRITRNDVAQALEGKTGTTAQPAAAPTKASVPVAEGDTREKIKGMRKAIYTSMSKSKTIIPHFTYVDEVEMDKLVDIRAGLKGAASDQGVKLTYLPFITKAVVLALKKFPILNASVDDEAGEIVYKHAYNIGIATATPAGLTVPVLKNVDKKNLLEIAGEIAELSDRARNRKSTLDDISGGTFTITSLGRLGGLISTPIINHPEVGILGIQNLQERAVVRDGQIVIRKMMNISLSFDHRVVDGDVGASFAQEVKSYLEEPGKFFLHMS